MKFLLVGLGNIGTQYQGTRHNIGFEVADRFASELGAAFELGRHAYWAKARLKSAEFVIIKPTTYMNLSGKAVQHWLSAEKILLENMLVVVDDLALPFGTLRLKGQGSAAGHNGLKDIEAILSTQNYPRLRFGIGSDYPKGRQVDFVLGKFNENEAAELPLILKRTVDIIASFGLEGISKTMTAFNR
jgi:PTH1 family peptidyl-tRNA hydrolase